MTNDDDGRDFGLATEAEWMPWGDGDKATARTVAFGDGYHQLLIKAQAGHTGTPHEHEHAEFSYILEGIVRHNGTTLSVGDGYGAAAGTTHDSFEALTDATYLTIFRL
jgi:anti-sigma factor ChrR (cupin superfamily)